ncbi:hypothetical protein [Croceibacterium mercuriale]|nr:hypothetical protein [Croceibacterium mercuriale]
MQKSKAERGQRGGNGQSAYELCTKSRAQGNHDLQLTIIDRFTFQSGAGMKADNGSGTGADCLWRSR